MAPIDQGYQPAVCALGEGPDDGAIMIEKPPLKDALLARPVGWDCSAQRLARSDDFMVPSPPIPLSYGLGLCREAGDDLAAVFLFEALIQPPPRLLNAPGPSVIDHGELAIAYLEGVGTAGVHRGHTNTGLRSERLTYPRKLTGQ